ncbi:hypothetical protein YSY43_36970 [Paenibacillus sp. YSY-4.3]
MNPHFFEAGGLSLLTLRAWKNAAGSPFAPSGKVAGVHLYPGVSCHSPAVATGLSGYEIQSLQLPAYNRTLEYPSE